MEKPIFVSKPETVRTSLYTTIRPFDLSTTAIYNLDGSPNQRYYQQPLVLRYPKLPDLSLNLFIRPFEFEGENNTFSQFFIQGDTEKLVNNGIAWTNINPDDYFENYPSLYNYYQYLSKNSENDYRYGINKKYMQAIFGLSVYLDTQEDTYVFYPEPDYMYPNEVRFEHYDPIKSQVRNAGINKGTNNAVFKSADILFDPATKIMFSST